MPTREELATWAKNYAELWNAGDKEAWTANWRKLCYGDFKMWDPVGTPPKFDFEGCCLEPYDLFQPSLQMYIDPETLFVNGNEVSFVMANTFTKDGKSQVMKSIENYRFGDDGSCEIRTCYDVPSADDPISGHLFAEYLPDDT